MAAAYMPMEHQIFLGCESTQKDKIQATFRELAPTLSETYHPAALSLCFLGTQVERLFSVTHPF